MSRNHLNLEFHYETICIDSLMQYMGVDRMLKRTQKAIVDAFNRLISQKRFDDITVVDIVSEADVCKATFYRYFHDSTEKGDGEHGISTAG